MPKLGGQIGSPNIIQRPGSGSGAAVSTPDVGRNRSRRRSRRAKSIARAAYAKQATRFRRGRAGLMIQLDSERPIPQF